MVCLLPEEQQIAYIKRGTGCNTLTYPSLLSIRFLQYLQQYGIHPETHTPHAQPQAQYVYSR